MKTSVHGDKRLGRRGDKLPIAVGSFTCHLQSFQPLPTESSWQQILDRQLTGLPDTCCKPQRLIRAAVLDVVRNSSSTAAFHWGRIDSVEDWHEVRAGWRLHKEHASVPRSRQTAVSVRNSPPSSMIPRHTPTIPCCAWGIYVRRSM